MPPPGPPRFLTLVLLTALSTLSLNLFVPSLPAIAATYGGHYSTVGLAIAGYLAATAVIQLVAGPVSDRIGRRPVALAALAVFAAASFGCAIAGSMEAFLAFRMAQAIIVAGWVLSLAVVRDTTPERVSASRIGYITMAMAVAPLIGPMLGGALDSVFGWRSSFIFFGVASVILLGLCWRDFGETRQERPDVNTAFLGGLSALLRSRQFLGYALCNAFSVSAFYVFLTGAPLVALARYGIGTAEIGLYIGSITAGFMAGSYLSGRFSRRYALSSMILAGRLLACLGLLAGLATVAVLPQAPLAVFGSTLFVGLGNGLTLPGGSAGAMSVDPALAGTAAGLNGALIVLVGAVATAVTGPILGDGTAPARLLAVMLALSALSLLAVLGLRRIERRETDVPAPQLRADR